MYINLPQNFTRKDIEYQGIIMKDRGKNFALSTIGDIKLDLNTNGFFCYAYTLYNTYLFLIGNQKGIKDINPKKIDFLQKIVEFEYNFQEKPRMFKNIDISDNIFYIMPQYLYQTFNERWLANDLTDLNSKSIDFIVNNIKTHLRTLEQPLHKYVSFMCDNENGIGITKNCITIKTLYENNIIIYKDKNIGGYIIKYNHDKFI